MILEYIKWNNRFFHSINLVFFTRQFYVDEKWCKFSPRKHHDDKIMLYLRLVDKYWVNTFSGSLLRLMSIFIVVKVMKTEIRFSHKLKIIRRVVFRIIGRVSYNFTAYFKSHVQFQIFLFTKAPRQQTKNFTQYLFSSNDLN